ncbi:L-aminopeptidase/D-esterase [Desulfitobacterium dichloroeliminans LMG P-21439]|uniref:L-aminopeptidase/D-esterase n=1 Tax=Desulfitobacterium dichloroeliminans (strain LMG P-21439 / DCA1) TaxID=871963 RepID=L0F709_DESDL|nr:P1 family peptidase [Desulfitobacterium dichloroeliminans]AGA69604.1 L-aminopeptidase/D-esterase [Desulfitobacterium dichloroeliminans LMG P-21439]
MQRKSARSYGLWMGELTPGPKNDITDVPGVLVGHVSLIKGSGPLIPGKGPVRTGVTAIRPHPGNLYRQPCWAGIHVINGFGKSLGVPFIQETGVLNSPILLTNTLSVNDAAQGMLSYLLKENPEIGNDARTPNLVVFECDDSYLNDIRGRHVKPWDAILALNRATDSLMVQGNVGAGVGMSLYQLKGGIGSASRSVSIQGRPFLIGMLALTNYGRLEDFLLNGVPVGLKLKINSGGEVPGSLILVGLTNAPLSRWQLNMLATRSAMGVGRTGGVSRMGSGEFCLMVNTNGLSQDKLLDDWEMDPLFKAVVELTAESIWNSMFFATSMEGRDEHVRKALPVSEILNRAELFFL